MHCVLNPQEERAAESALRNEQHDLLAYRIEQISLHLEKLAGGK